MKQRKVDSQKRVAFPIQLYAEDRVFADEMERESEIHIVPTGEWEHWSGSEFEITPDTIKDLVANFKAGPKDIPITAGHDMYHHESPAVGWFTELIDKGVKGLYGYVKWTEDGKKMLRDRAWKYFSAELAFDYYDLELKQKFDVLLTGGALTNKPFFKKLDMDPAMSFSEQDKNVLAFEVPEIITQFNNNVMNLKDILAKKAAGETLSAEEIAFVKGNEDELSDDEKVAVAEIIAEDPADPAPADPAPADPAPADPAPADPEPVTPLSRKDGQVVLSAAQFDALERNANSGAEAARKIDVMELSARVDKFVVTASNKDGKFLPRQKDAILKFMTGLDTKQRDQFTTIVNAMPKASALFSEIGDQGAVSGTAKAELDGKIEAMRKADTKLSYSDALRAVFSQNPDLETRYNEELGSGE